MSTEITVRPYKPADREAVRKICGDTADRGKPVERFFRDRQVVVDILTSYYTDYELRATWVAESQGQVIGYLTGCVNERKYNLLMGWIIIPKAVLSAIFRGVLFHQETRRLLSASFRTWRLGSYSKNIPTDKYPAHLHIDIAQEYRGKHAGHQLMERFIAQVKAYGLSGIHSITREDNTPACKFFEKMGFVPLSRHPLFLPNAASQKISHTVVYGLLLNK